MTGAPQTPLIPKAIQTMNDFNDFNELIALADQYEQSLPPLPALPEPPSGGAIASWIDHTLLKPEADAAQIENLCHQAREYGFASVCVNPAFVPLAGQLLAGTSVLVCSVVGFPLGATLTDVKVFETQACLQAGAGEIDMVINIGALKGGDYASVFEDIGAVVQAAHARDAVVKVILEMALLTRREKIIACLLSKTAGADFVKTSTGFGPGGATAEDVELMRRVVGAEMGVKAAGGIRSLADFYTMVRAGANRIGASAGVAIVQESLQSGE